MLFLSYLIIHNGKGYKSTENTNSKYLIFLGVQLHFIIRFISMNSSSGVMFSFCQLDTTRDTWEETALYEVLHPSEWPLGEAVWNFMD